MNAAERVIEKFGSAAEVARVCGVSRSAVSRWPKDKANGGMDGNVPSHFHRPLMMVARTRGIDLRADDLVNVD